MFTITSSMEKSYITVLIVMAGLVITVRGGVVLDSSESVSLERHHGRIGPTVHHFARHSLCNAEENKIKFYNALEDHLCELSSDLRYHLVIDLCNRKDDMLDKWVSEVYDIDRDGHVSHHEVVAHEHSEDD